MSASLKLMKFNGKRMFIENIVMVIFMAIISVVAVFLIKTNIPKETLFPVMYSGLLMLGLTIVLIVYCIRQITGMLDLSKNLGITRNNYFLYNLISNIVYALVLSLIFSYLAKIMDTYGTGIDEIFIDADKTIMHDTLLFTEVFLDSFIKTLYTIGFIQFAAFSFYNFKKYALILIPVIVIFLSNDYNIPSYIQILVFIISQIYLFVGLRKFK